MCFTGLFSVTMVEAGYTSVSSSFQSYETRRGETNAISNPPKNLVDYESVVEIKPDRAALSRAIGLGPTKEQSREISLLQEQIKAIRKDIRIVLGLVESYERFYASFDPSKATQLKYVELWTKQLAIVSQLKTNIHEYVNQRYYYGKWNYNADDESKLGISLEESDVANDHVSSIYNRIAPSASNYSPDAITEFLNEYISLLNDKIEKYELALIKDNAQLEMEAKLVRGKEQIPVTISPYTKVAGSGRGQKSKRIGIPSEEDTKRVADEYKAYNELAKTINVILDKSTEENIKNLQRDIVTALSNSFSSVTNSLLTELNDITNTNDTTLAVYKADAQAIIDKTKAVKKQIETLIKSASADTPISPVEVAAEATTIVAGIEAIKENVVILEQKASSSQNLAANQKKWLDDVLKKAGDALDTGLKNTNGDFAQLYVSLMALKGLPQRQSFGKLDGRTIARTPFSIALSPAGVVHLADTPAEQGDDLMVIYSVTVNPRIASEESENTYTFEGSKLFGVRKFGWYTTYNAQLLFFNRLSDNSSSFRAAPGVGYNFHYRPISYGHTFYDIFAPGLGINVSAPSFETGTELAVGVQLTLLKNFLQLGYGYNLSVEDDPHMFFFALDLIQTFQAVPR